MGNRTHTPYWVLAKKTRAKDWGEFTLDWNNLENSIDDLIQKHHYKTRDSLFKAADLARKHGHNLIRRRNVAAKRIDWVQFAYDWNHDMPFAEIIKKYNCPNRRRLLDMSHRARSRYGIELKKRVRLGKDSTDPDSRPELIPSDFDESLRQSIITSFVKGAPNDINAQLHDVKRAVVNAVIVQYKQNRENNYSQPVSMIVR